MENLILIEVEAIWQVLAPMFQKEKIANLSMIMVLMNIKTDRGIELNKRRLREEFTDISLVIDDQKFPAHRMIGNF